MEITSHITSKKYYWYFTTNKSISTIGTYRGITSFLNWPHLIFPRHYDDDWLFHSLFPKTAQLDMLLPGLCSEQTALYTPQIAAELLWLLGCLICNTFCLSCPNTGFRQVTVLKMSNSYSQDGEECTK